MPGTFHKEWSPDHLRIIDKIERAALNAEMFAVAMPRGSGKTSLCLAVVLWAVLMGFHRYIVLVAANTKQARKLLRNLKTWLTTNDLLAADFPEVLHAVRQLNNEARRAAGQIHHGNKTHVEWGTDQIIMPTIPGSRASGAVVSAAGLLTGTRGLQHTTPDGKTIRPTFAVVDDPQTDTSARSRTMTNARVETIQGTIGGLAAAGERMGIMVPCTVVAPDDLAEQLLDHDLFPEYRGERTENGVPLARRG